MCFKEDCKGKRGEERKIKGGNEEEGGRDKETQRDIVRREKLLVENMCSGVGKEFRSWN